MARLRLRLPPPMALALGLSCAAPTACVSDPNIENDVPAEPGAKQPSADGGATLNFGAACSELADAEKAERSKLGCKVVTRACPAYVAVAGALPCDLYVESTVAACVAAIRHYGACSDFDTKPCVVTAVASSCHAPVVTDAGSDASNPHPDGSTPTDSGRPKPPADASGGTDTGAGNVTDAGPPDAARIADASSHPG